MNKIFITILLISSCYFFSIITPDVSISQTLTEQEIYSDKTKDNVDVYNFITDESTGNYCYIDYNNYTSKYTIKSRYGESEEFSYISAYDIKFDSKGNYYSLVSNYNEDDSLEYFLIANGETISQFQNAESYSSFVDKNDDFKFVYSEDDSVMIGTYSINNGLTTSEKYVSASPIYRYKFEYEYDIDLGQEDLFEDKDGNYGFVVSDGATSDILFGDNLIKTPYTDINSNSFIYDKQGSLCYIAKMDGKFFENKGREFVVQGDKKYKEFEYIYPPILINKENVPVYISIDSTEIGFVYKVVIGDDYQKVFSDDSKTKEGAVYTGGVYSLNVDSNDNITYYASVLTIQDGNLPDELYSYLYNVTYVINGIEQKFYYNPGLWKFNNTRSLISYMTDTLLNKSKLLLKKGNKEKIINKMDFNEIPDYGFINNTNKIYYVGVNRGDWTKKVEDQYYVFVDNERIGNYEAIIYQNFMGDYSLLKFNKKGDFAFTIQESEVESEENESYEYYTYVVTNDGRQPPVINFETDKKSFDYIQNLFYTRNDKLFYIAGIYNDLKNSDQILIMVDNKPLDKIYNSVYNLSYDEDKNMVDFIASRDKSIYKVKIFF